MGTLQWAYCIGWSFGSVLIMYCPGMMPMGSKDLGNASISVVMSLAALSVDLGVVFRVGSSMVLERVVLWRRNNMSSVVLEEMMISGVVWKVMHVSCLGCIVKVSICAVYILLGILLRQSLAVYKKRIGGLLVPLKT